MRFPGFYGNENLKKRLTASAQNFSHCYILEGPSGSGKKTLANILAAAMECESNDMVPCGVCPSCRKVFKSEHPDVIMIDSNTATVPIRLIRDMQADAYIMPNEGKKKIYILPRAQDMQPPAQNALLKLLEEPPEYCAFLLITDNIEKLLETVQSRAVTLTLSPLSQNQLLTALKEREPNTTQDDLIRAMEQSEGYLGTALEVLHAPETESNRQISEIIQAISSKDDLKILTALLPLEKLKRQDLLNLLTDLKRIFVRAMDANAIHTKNSQLLIASCNKQQLFDISQTIAYAITLLQANGSAGHAVGSMIAQIQLSS